ncbi:MAG: TIR domain-containing protein [Coleofasciculaceae cyanobacterium]
MSNQSKNNESLPGLHLQRTLQGHDGLISRLAWSPDGKTLASASFDSTIGLWNPESGEHRILRGHFKRVQGVVWSPDGLILASCSSDDTIRFWDLDLVEKKEEIATPTDVHTTIAWSPDGLIASGGMVDGYSILFWNRKTRNQQLLEGHFGQINSLAWSPDGKLLASGSHDATVRIWDRETAQLRGLLQGHSADVYRVKWSPDGKLLASASLDSTIRIWEPNTGRTLFVLEGHTDSVNCISFSFDGKLLASKSSDGTVRLWRCDTWETIKVIEESTAKHFHFGLDFHPKLPILATLGEEDTAIRIWNVDLNSLFTASPINSYVKYACAKVVLVGDSGVGKSGLGLVLSGEPFQLTESTHGRVVKTFHSSEIDLEDGHKEKHEVLLWDLAGQPGYRLIHQLHLNEVAVALIVFDARSETNPFAGVYYWNRALRQAQILRGNSGTPLKKLLVEARADRGRVGVSSERIKKLVSELGCDDYIETSAKEGWQIPELKDKISESIDWNVLEKVISTELFRRIKVFLIEEKQSQRLLPSIDELYRSFLQSGKAPTKTSELREQFETCIRHVESRGLIYRLSFGNFVLLQPELLDSYASAIVNAAKGEPEGLGSILEEDILAARCRMPTDEHIQDREQEKLLLIATVKELLDREIALREQTEEGSLLVLPSQFTREWPPAPDPEGKAVIFEFEGAILNIYTTLVVRLSRSELFQKQKMWKNAVIFRTLTGNECGMWLRPIEEGRAELTLFFKPEATKETRSLFEKYVHTHIKRKALPERICRRRIFVCPESECATPVTELQVQRRRERGYDWINCSVCDNRISLLDQEEQLSYAQPSGVHEIDKAADTKREVEKAVSIIRGKMETKEFDVFLAHNSRDKPQIEAIAKYLRQRGLNPWLDKEQIPPGRWFQDVIQQAIPRVKSAAIFIGVHGIGRWQILELREFIRQCVEEELPVIPVLLPSVTELPKNLSFLSQLHAVLFREEKGIDDTEALDSLEWGIVGEHPRRRFPSSSITIDVSE